ncbi:MAG: hypothetical protein CMG34_07260 [Candidatus Marinimicrobia bacterium]|nr:hypothetical protein [Candidatus Neomarinimicrobiota bacterium]
MTYGENGSVIGPQNLPTSSAASGIWSMGEVAEAVRGGSWPEPKDGWFYIFNYQPGTYSTSATNIGLNSSTGQVIFGGHSWNPDMSKYAATWALVDSAGTLNTTTQPIIRASTYAYDVYGSMNGLQLDANSSNEWFTPFRFQGSSQLNVGMWMMESDGSSKFTPSGFGQTTTGYGFTSSCAKLDSNDRLLYSYQTTSSVSSNDQYEIWCFPNTFPASPSSTTDWKVRVYASSYTTYPYYNKFNPTGGIVVGASDDVYIGFQKGLDANLYSGTVGAYPWALAKYNSSGTRQWMNWYGMSYGGSYKVGFSKMSSIDSSDNVYLTGYNADNGTSGTPAIMNKVDSSGTHQWHRCFYNTTASQGNTHPYYSQGGCVKSDGSLVIQTAYTYLDTSSTKYKSLLFAMNSSGTVQWATKISAKKTSDNSETSIYVNAITFDETGDYLYINFSLNWDGRNFMMPMKIKADGTHDSTGTADVWDLGGSTTTNLTFTVEPLSASDYSTSNSYFSVSGGSINSSTGYFHEGGTTSGEWTLANSGNYSTNPVDVYNRPNETLTGGI